MHTMLLNHLTNAFHLVDRSIVNNENRIWQRPLVHEWEETLNELVEVVAHNGILNNLKMDNSIEREGREDRVLGAMK